MTESTARLVRTTLETFAISLGIVVVSAVALRMIETGVVEARAATIPAQPWHAQTLPSATPTIDMRAGSRHTHWVEFRNTGTATWTRDGDHFVAMNVTNPTGRTSAFRDIFWPTDYRPARLFEERVAPGATGRFAVALTAPQTPGTYVEDFGLVAENLTWITGGTARLTIRVMPTPDFRAELAQT
ncbi:MAG: hypothetical protein HY341_00270, partial [Candidatus Kerfeldbacteria bacterium]|nr:hypothetical protein [Candidatus Kerfeldbacteria bacterium]